MMRVTETGHRSPAFWIACKQKMDGRLPGFHGFEPCYWCHSVDRRRLYRLVKSDRCGSDATRTRALADGVRYQIGCQMGIEGIHGHLIAGIGTKANEPVGSHEDGPTIGNVRHPVELRRIDNRDKSFPAPAKIVQTRRVVRHDKMVGRTAKVVACSETDSNS